MQVNQSNLRKLLLGVLGGSSFIAILFLSQSQLSSIRVADTNRLAQTPTIESPTPTSSPDSQTGNSLVQVVASNKLLSNLALAIDASGLKDTLSGQISYTLFAPTNEAFSDLPKGTLRKLLLPQNQVILAKILTYHLVVGEVTASQIKSGQVPTVEGDFLTFNVNSTGNKITVNKARVTKSDIQASNGVIHTINKVLLPPGVKLSNLSS